MADELENVTEDNAPVQEQAESQAASAVEDIKEEVDKRDDAILQELRAIHTAIDSQTEHHIRHLEAHTLAPSAPVQEAATDATDATEKLPDEPVSLEIGEAQDMPKEETKEHRKSRKFGKRGKRV